MKKNILILLLLLCLVVTVGCAKTEKTEKAWLSDITTLESTDLPMAFEEIKALVEKHPTFSEGWAAYGRIALATGKDNEAFKAGTEWVKLEPNNIDAARFTAQAALVQKDADLLFALLTPFQEKGQLTLSDEILLARGHFIKRDFAQVHTLVDALLLKDLDDAQASLCYETNFNAYLLESDFTNAFEATSAANKNLSLDYNSILYRMHLHLAIDPAEPETFHAYQQIIQSYSKVDKAKFVQLCLSDLNLLDRLGFKKDYLPRVLELLSEQFAYIGGEPDNTFQSIGNGYHSFHIGQMGEQVFIIDPKTFDTVLHYPGNKDVIHLSEEFESLDMPNVLINGWQFVTSYEGMINLTGFTKVGNIISTPVVPLSVYANYLDGNNLIVIDDNSQLFSIDLQTKAIKNLNFDMADSIVIGIRDHHLLAFSYTENTIIKIDLATGKSTNLTTDRSLAQSDIVDYDGSFIYCINAWPSDAFVDSKGQWFVHSELLRIDPNTGVVEKITDVLTSDPGINGNPDTTYAEKADRVDAMMAGGDYLYLNTAQNQVFRIKKDGSQLESIGISLQLYGVTDSSAYFKDSNSDSISTHQHGASPSSLQKINME